MVAASNVDLGGFWDSEACAEELDSYSLSTDVALLAAKREQWLQEVPVLLEKGMRDRILKAFRALSYCADTKYYHEHWFQLAELLDRATAALARNGSSLVSGGPSSRNAARLAAAVFGLSSKLRSGEQCEHLLAVADVLTSAAEAGPWDMSVASISAVETEILAALDWNLPSGTSFSSLTMLYSRLAIFSRRGLPALERAWTVSVKLVQDMALLAAHDFEVTLGALLYGMLSDRLISLEDVLVEHDETVAVLAATMDLLGSKQPNPRFYACIERATLSSRKELHAALCRVLDEVRKVELAKTQGS